jgi:nicotinamide riboside kinase
MIPPQSVPGPLRVAILGAESSGKSTLAAGLAQRYRSAWVPEYLREFVDTMGRVLALLAGDHLRHYGLTLVTAADIPWMADGLQRESAAVTRIIDRMLLEELAARAIPYVLLEGDPAARMAQVERLLSAPSAP